MDCDKIAAFISIMRENQAEARRDEEGDEGGNDDHGETTDATLNHALAMCGNHDIGFGKNSGSGNCG